MDDLISRQEAIDAVYDLPNCPNGYSDTYDKAYIIGLLEELPAAEPKRGKWEYNDYGGFGNWHCTACGEICICNGGENYCPNCGAKMGE